jgi:hypothetical protein
MEKKLTKDVKIKALRQLKGVSSSYSTPERIDIPAGTILKVPSSGTNRGDLFCEIIEGEPIVHCRGYNNDKPRTMSPNSWTDKVGLSEGFNSRYPYDLGVINTDCWEIIK